MIPQHLQDDTIIDIDEDAEQSSIKSPSHEVPRHKPSQRDSSESPQAVSANEDEWSLRRAQRVRKLAQQSFSQVGENLAESRDFDSINQIRISNRNLPN